MGSLILFICAIVIGVVLGLVLRKVVLDKNDKTTDEYLKNKGTTLERELQNCLDANGQNVRVTVAKPHYVHKYMGGRCRGIVTKFQVEGKSEWFTGIVSDNGSCTDLVPFHPVKYYGEGIRLLQKVYKLPNREVDTEFLATLPQLPNAYNERLRSDEYVIYNSIVDNFKTDGGISIGLKAKLTMTDKTIYVNNGAGIFMIDLYNDIHNCVKANGYVEIELSEICTFGQNGERICTGYKLFFSSEEEAVRFDGLMNKILKERYC